MTGYELRLWRKSMGWDRERAAEELDKSLRTYKTYETSAEVNRTAELATRALTLKSLLPTLSGKESVDIIRILTNLTA